MEQPRRIDQYDIVGPLGEGAMASVFRARASAPAAPGSPRALPQVALKLIAAHLGGAREFQLRFSEEVRVASMLSHPNIVRTFGSGSWHGRPYLVMELVDGLSLRQLMALTAERRVQLPVEVGLYIALQLCAALDYAHRYELPGMPLSLVHRDVSPSNVLLSRAGEVKLADFGIAKARGRVVASSADLLKGKLGYMAPEQVRGAEEPRSDLYSLAAVLYELLCGQPIRLGATLESVRLARVPRAPSSLRAMSRQLDALLLRCLSPNPGRRPATAADLRGHLQLQLKQLSGSPDAAEQARRALADCVNRLLGPLASSPPPPTTTAGRPTAPAPERAFSNAEVVARAPAPGAPPRQLSPPPRAALQTGGLAAVASEPSILPLSGPSEDELPPKKRRLLVAVSAALFVAAGAAIGVMMAVEGGDDASAAPPMVVRDAMVPGYARRVPVLAPRKLDAGSADQQPATRESSAVDTP